MTFDSDLDCLGLLCPLPVLRARKRLIGMQPGMVLRVLATDAMAAVDLPHFCAEAGHDFLESQPVESQPIGSRPGDRAMAYFIRRGLG